MTPGPRPACSSFPREAGGRFYNADPDWDRGRTNGHKQNRGCFLSLKASTQPATVSSTEDWEAGLRVRADSAGGVWMGARTWLVSREESVHG